MTIQRITFFCVYINLIFITTTSHNQSGIWYVFLIHSWLWSLSIFFTSVSKTLAHRSYIQKSVFFICIWVNLVKCLLFYFWRLLAKTECFFRSSFIKNRNFSNSLRNYTISCNIGRIIFTFEIWLSCRFFNSERLSVCSWPSKLHFECTFFIESFCWLTRII